MHFPDKDQCVPEISASAFLHRLTLEMLSCYLEMLFRKGSKEKRKSLNFTKTLGGFNLLFEYI